MVARQLIVGLGQSNEGGIGVAANVTVFQGITNPYAAVPTMSRGSKLTDPPNVVFDPASGSRALSPRTVSLGAPYSVGTIGILPTMGRILDAARPGVWAMGEVWLDGSSLQTRWMPGSAYPIGGPPWFTQVVGYIQNMESTMGAALAGIVWIQGTSDALAIPDQDNYLSNLVTFFSTLRAVPGWSNVAITVDQISSQFIANFDGGSAVVGGAKVRAAQQTFVSSTARTALVNTDDLALRDNAHYADDSYAILGIRHANAMLALLGIQTGFVGLGIGLR